MRTAVYARVSTERQERQQTIDSQLDALQAWAKSANHELTDAHVFRDEGYSGSRLDRPGLDALRDAVRDREVDVVAVLAPDRLARRYAYQVLLLEEFRRAGCAVEFLTHAISDDPGDQLLLQIQGAVAEYERALLSERFRRGKLQKARAGQFIGPHAPYGYHYRPRQDGACGQLAVDDEEAELVHTLYGWLVGEREPDPAPDPQATELRPLGPTLRPAAMVTLDGPPHPVRSRLYRNCLLEPLRIPADP